MRSLLLACACVYAAKSYAPAVIRYYFDVVLFQTLIGYAVLHYWGDTSRIYTYVYCVLVSAVVLAGFAVSMLYCQFQEHSLAIYLLCCGLGLTAGLTLERFMPLDRFQLIMTIEGGAFLAIGLIMSASINCSETPEARLVAAVLAVNWISKALLDFALARWNFSPRLLEAGAVLPWAFFLSSAVVVGFSFRKSSVVAAG